MRLMANPLLLMSCLLFSLMSTSVYAANKNTEADELVTLIMKTSRGDIELQLNRSKAPISVENFLTYVKANHYNGTVFHRVIRDFMIQGGGFNDQMERKATLPPIKNEAQNGLRNDRGTIAMARTGQIDSATAQFFINTKDNNFLNHGFRDFGYAVFGKVTKGMDVVDEIGNSVTGARDVPIEPIVITDVIISKKAE